MRPLIYVPIIHSEVDMGKTAPALRRAYAARFGPRRWRQHQQLIAAFWKEIEAALRHRRIDYGHVKLYQDGLPVCGHEGKIVQALAAQGSPNHGLLRKLMGKGAQLVGTEDPTLLLREYKQIRAELTQPQPPLTAKRVSQSLLRRRDRFVARRIDATLAGGETGIVFMGALHRVFELLPADIRVDILLPRGLPTAQDGQRHPRKKSRKVSL